MTTTRARTLYAVLLCGIVAGCGRSSDTAPSDSRPTDQQQSVENGTTSPRDPRDQLLAQLVKRADEALAADERSVLAYNSYEFASIYAPWDKRIRETLAGLTEPFAGQMASSEAMAHFRSIAGCDPQTLLPWTMSTGTDIEVKELRVLVAQDLTGDLTAKALYVENGAVSSNLTARSSPFVDEYSGQFVLFLHTPSMTHKEILASLGSPTSELTIDGKIAAIDYGRFRINLDENENALGVFFIPYEKSDQNGTAASPTE